MDGAASEPVVCRLCGLVVRGEDDAARMGEEYFHLPCAEAAFEDEPAWKHTEVGALNLLAQGAGRARF